MAREAERDGETAAPFLPPLRRENSRKREKKRVEGRNPSAQPAGERSAFYARQGAFCAPRDCNVSGNLPYSAEFEGCGEMRGIYYDNAPYE